MTTYQILVAGTQNGYIKTELIEVQASSLEEAAILAEMASVLDGACAKI